MNNEPIAWVELEAWESGKYPPDDCFAEHPFQNAIPLYTHPVKELTDDELFHAIRRVGWTSIQQTDEIVEAIRKAQEK